MRGCYHHILRPRRQFPKFANALCRHSDAWVRFDPHLVWQATESYVKRRNAFGLIPHDLLSLNRLRLLTPETYNPSPFRARSVRELSDWNSVTTSPEVGQAWRRRTFGQAA
jgi:hypothetical protein